MIGQTVSHYNILEKLGEGGMGIVYKAEDIKLKRMVALKFIPPERTRDPVSKERFFIEAQAAAALNHANIVTVFEIDEFDERVFMAMEYVQGENLEEKIGPGPLGIDEALKIAVQSAEGLLEAHKEGIIHRDIKSANIMINEKGQVKVLDFGLARLKGHTRVTKPSTTVGTAAYMSPEQSRGDEVDHRTDIWSLGVVLYEMVTGKLPFKGNYQAAVIYSIVNEDPGPITGLRGDVGEALERIVAKALEKNPDQRYQVMEDLLTDLRAIGGEIQPVPGALPVKRHIVGREKERAQLQEGLQTVFAGQGLLMCVAGEPGIGKTTLVKEFLAEVNAAAKLCTSAQGHCSERLAGSEAYLPFLEMLESLIKSRSDGSTAKMMRDKAPWWYAQVASLSADDPLDVRLMEEVKTATQERVKRELAAFLQEVSRLGPVVFLFEDLHWADVSSIDMLSYLATKFDAMRLLVVATYRPADLMLAKHPFLQIKPDLLSRGRCREIFLGFLCLEDIKSYLALEFSGHDFPADFPALIHDKTEGNPLFMTDLVRDLQNRGVIVEEKERWTLSQSAADIRLELPESVQGMIQQKIGQLSEENRRILAAAAVQGSEFDSAVVAAVLELDAEVVEERLDELERVHTFVRFIDEHEFPDQSLTIRCQFVHVLYQNQLYSSLTRTKQARLSKAVAEALLGYYGEQSSTVASRLAVLLETARDYIRAAHYFCLATQNAFRALANQEAILLAHRGLELLEKVADAPGKTQQELDLQLTLGPVLMAAKGFTDPVVEQTYNRALELCQKIGETPQLFSALWGQWVFNFCGGTLGTAREKAEQLLSVSQQGQDQVLNLMSQHAIWQVLHWSGEFVPAMDHLEEITSFYDPQKYHSLVFLYGGNPGLWAIMYTAWDLWKVGYPDQSLVKIQEAIALSRDLSDYFSLCHALSVAMSIFQCCGDTAGIRETGKLLFEACTEYGISQWLPWGYLNLGWALTEEGNMEEGMLMMQQSLGYWQGAGMKRAVTFFLALQADAFKKAGQTEKGLATVEEAFSSANETGERFLEAEMHRLKGELLLEQGKAEPEAEECFCRALEVARRQSAKSLELRAVMSLSRLRQKQGKQEDAHEMLSEIYGWFTEGFGTADLKEAKALLEELS